MVSDIGPPVRYTSYHSDKTFSILDRALQNVKNKDGVKFEYNGLEYLVTSRSFDKDDKWKLCCLGPMYEYLMPWSEGDYEKPVVVEFDRDTFEEFIETFEIEGKTVKWILEHQKSWKYKFSAKHFEEILTGFSFWFVYRKMPCGIYYAGGERDTTHRAGRYISMYPSISFDVTQYAPLVPLAKHWYDVQGRFPPDGEPQTVEAIESGPFQTVGELLDTVQLNYKTLREIFDTEYDDGAVCCGMFDG
ncbi:MAG: hypothetical protein METHP_01490 [Methanoregula sp. SKADARSKE-2]|nr:MAG: hypothetical protein METHP_01490 [Methanoregula sp. SKADARSKE-2]